MPQVFVSHSSLDRTFLDQELLPLLRRHEITPWYSTDDIPSASLWERRIREGLTSSDWFLVVISPHALASEWVRTEVHWAVDHRADRLIPVVIADADPSELNLRLIRYQYIDYRHEPRQARAILLRAFGKTFQEVGPETLPTDEPQMEVGFSVKEGLAAPGAARIVLVKETATIGRADTADIRFRSFTMARKHAILRVRQGKGGRTLWLCDLGSSNGTFLNTTRLRDAMQINVGDTIQLGDVRLTIKSLRDVGTS